MLKFHRLSSHHNELAPRRTTGESLMMPTRRTLVVGEVGAGKTWLCALLAAQGGSQVVALSEASTWPGPSTLTYGSDLGRCARQDAPQVMADLVRTAAARARESSALLVLDCPTWDGPLTLQDGEPTAYLEELQEVLDHHPGPIILTAYPQDLERLILDIGEHSLVSIVRHHDQSNPYTYTSSPENGWGTATMTASDTDGVVATAVIPYLTRDPAETPQPPALEIESCDASA